MISTVALFWALCVVCIVNMARYFSSLRALLVVLRGCDPLLYQYVDGGGFFTSHGQPNKQVRLVWYIYAQRYRDHHDDEFIRRWDKFPIAPERRANPAWAENTVDGIIAPLFFLLLGGAPRAIAIMNGTLAEGAQLPSMRALAMSRSLFSARAVATSPLSTGSSNCRHQRASSRVSPGAAGWCQASGTLGCGAA